jgi:hypothetical protein
MGQRTVTGQESAKQEPDRPEDFLSTFFGEGNDAGHYADTIEPFIQALSRRGDSVLVLPRYISRDDRFRMYVVPPARAQVIPVADLIEAFAGPTYCTEGDAYPAQLNPDDPVEAALASFTGQDEAFVIQAGPKPARRAQLRGALALMQGVVASRPTRLWHVPKPLGRLLAEFDAALAAGGEAASKSALDQLAAQGGITATNLAHLRIKRLDRLGRSEELMAMPGLANVLMQDPPVPVKEAILNALYSTTLEEPGDIPALRRMAASLHDTGRSGIPHAPWQAVLELLDEQKRTPPLRATPDLTARPTGQVSPPAPAVSPIPASWPALFAGVAANRPQAKAAVQTSSSHLRRSGLAGSQGSAARPGRIHVRDTTA